VSGVTYDTGALIAEDGTPSTEAYAWADRVLAMSEPELQLAVV
jgi:hypothetical protein